MTEEKALLVSSIPDRIWKKYQLKISPNGSYIWFGTRARMSFSTAYLQHIFFYEDSITLAGASSFASFHYNCFKAEFFFS
jgi:hypothetical protein